MCLRRLFPALAALVFAASIHGYAQVSCPAEISVQQQMTNSVPGWKATEADIPHRLANITFFSGPPEEHESLVNDRETKVGGKNLAVWNFGKSSDRPLWLSCSYSGTTMTLAKTLPSGITSCSVLYNPRQRIAGMPLVEKIDCR